MASGLKGISKLGIALLLAIAAVALAWPWERAYMQSISILRVLQHKRVPLLFAGVALHPMTREIVTIPDAGNAAIRAYLYEPTTVANPRDIVLIHGVHSGGMDEPRLVTFAIALSQSGFRVLTPEISSFKDYQVTPASIHEVQTAALWLSQRDHSNVGLIGLSFGGGIALLAAADASVQPHVAWVWSIGGHASMARVADYYVTGKATGADGQEFSLGPHEYGPLVLIYDHPEDYLTPAERTAIIPVLRAHLLGNTAGEQLLASRLSPALAQKWKSILDTNSSAEQQMGSVAAPRHSAEYAAVSPEGHIGELSMPVFLLHGAADNVIPPTELSWLAKGLPSGAVRESLVSGAISHVSLGEDPGIAEDWRLVHYFANVLHYAER